MNLEGKADGGPQTIRATEVANRVAYGAGQIFGGYAYMREFPIERFYRDMRVWTIGAGTLEIMKEIIAKRMRG